MNSEKRLTSVVVIVSVAVLAFLVIGGVAVYNQFFPLAAPVDCPNLESITAISLTQNSGISVAVEPAHWEACLLQTGSTQPTRIWSVQDSPAAAEYFTMEVETAGRTYRYYIYADRSRVYLESPYEGVYRTNQQFLDFAAGFFAN